MFNVLRKTLLVGVSLFAIHSQIAWSECVHNEIVLKAAREGNLKLIAVYAEMPDFELKEICDKNNGKLSLLHVAAKAGKVDMVQYLLEEIGFDVEDRNNDENVTPLHYAILSRDAGTCFMLLSKDARMESVHPNIKRVYTTHQQQTEKKDRILDEDGFLRSIEQ